ncbi:MAG: winged helix-turn-helix domain-containing protein [Lachnospiraceae bacterium]|nr:winged helix-turn-helix domain-containing protein [Lachnospiraceae bacterium]
MDQLKNEIKSKIRIQYNECFEFARAIEYLCERYEKPLPDGVVIDENDISIKEKLKTKVTKDMQKDIQWLYKNLNISGIIEAYAVDYHTSTVDEMLYAIEGSDDVVLCNYIGGIYISKFKAQHVRDWSEVKHSVELMKNFVRECQVIDESTRSNVVKCLEAPRDTKKKIITILRKLYKDAYSKIKLAVEKLLAEAQKQYMEQLFLTPVDFVNRYFRNDFRVSSGKWAYRMVIHLSLFDPVDIKKLSIHDYIGQEGYLVLGKEAIQWYNDENQSRIICQFLKAISDENRLTILKQLSIKPSYGKELAEKLNLTPATIKHHLALLEELKLIKASRTEHKVYYLIDKESLNQGLEDLKTYLM